MRKLIALALLAFGGAAQAQTYVGLSSGYANLAATAGAPAANTGSAQLILGTLLPQTPLGLELSYQKTGNLSDKRGDAQLFTTSLVYSFPVSYATSFTGKLGVSQQTGGNPTASQTSHTGAYITLGTEVRLYPQVRLRLELERHDNFAGTGQPLTGLQLGVLYSL